MRLSAAAVLAACSIISAPALAEEPPPAWSIGTGFGFGGTWYDQGGPGIPAVFASLERRLGERDALVLGGFGALRRAEGEVPNSIYAAERDDGQRLYLTAGVRHALARPGAPVAVSLTALAYAGAESGTYRLRYGGGAEGGRYSAWLAGASLGIAIDRELVPGLSVRVASELLQAGYARSRRELAADEPDLATRAFSAGARILPRLELRLAF